MRSTKTKIASLITVGALTLTAASPALAQDNRVPQVNQGNLISALNNINANINDVIDVTDSLNNVDVRVVDVDNVANNNNVLNNALNRNDVDINVLRDFLNESINNNVLGQALQNADVNVSDVVAVDVLSGGDIVIFVN